MAGKANVPTYLYERVVLHRVSELVHLHYFFFARVAYESWLIEFR